MIYLLVFKWLKSLLAYVLVKVRTAIHFCVKALLLCLRTSSTVKVEVGGFTFCVEALERESERE